MYRRVVSMAVSAVAAVTPGLLLVVAASLTTGLVTHSTADQPCDPGEWPCRDRSRSQHLLPLVESRQAVEAWSFRHCGGVT